MLLRIPRVALLAVPLLAPLLQDATERGVTIEEPDAETSSGYTNRHALVVGIDEYVDSAFQDLSYAVADAEAIAKILIDRYGFEQDDVKLLLNEDATRDALSEALEEWAADAHRVGEDDLFVLFFAGHGETRDLGRRGDRGYLVPSDGRRGAWSSLLGMNDLEEASELVPAKHALFILDSCFSGLAVNRSAPPIAAGLTSRARQVITAGNAQQTVEDGGGQGHSVFTQALLHALGGDADLDADGVVTYGELANHVASEVERRTEQRQTPLRSEFPDHEGGSVALFPPGLKPGGMSAAERLKALERTAEERLAELERVSDVLVVQDLFEEADSLWPPHPETISAYRHWLAGARETLERRAGHRASVRQVRQEAFLEQVVAGLVEERENSEPDWNEIDPKVRWRFETFSKLVGRLESLEHDLVAEDATTVEHGWSIGKRLAFAERLETGFALGGKYDQLWQEALPAIKEAYPDLDLKPQMGLVPIGPDPDSELWEFAHLATGEPAVRGKDRKLVLSEKTGVVLVLIPAGSFWMGAQAEDTEGQNYDPEARSIEGPVHEVELSAYFLSKYELTQGQWKRVTGRNPCYYQAGRLAPTTLLHPVENMSWLDCMAWLPRVGLALPSEAQWEHGCRAGTKTVWWTGPNRESLRERRAANLADQAAGRADATWDSARPAINDWPELDDGYEVHAPVGSFAPNAFGLHEVHGNVWEWCADGYDSGYYGSSSDKDPQGPLTAVVYRVSRGGGFYSTSALARSASRRSDTPTYGGLNLGVRPAWVISTD